MAVKNKSKRSASKGSSKRTERVAPNKAPSFHAKAWMAVRNGVGGARRMISKFMARRPHRSFLITKRRDYARDLRLPGYVSLTSYVWRTLQKHWKTFFLLIMLYSIVIIVVGGITSQDIYVQIRSLLQSSSKDLFGSGLGDVGQAGLLAISAFAGLSSTITTDQQIYLGIALIFGWLCTVWLLREFLMKRKPKLRDGLYNSGSPFISTLLVVVIGIVQLLPLGIVALLYAGFSAVGWISSGFGSMLFWIVASLIIVLSLYWLTSTLIALVIVTLPGVYPIRAMKLAGDIVLSRRLRVLYRLLWGAGMIAVTWLIVMIPVILLNSLAASIWSVMNSIPIVPYFGAILTSFTVVWYAAYVYLFYRKMVDND
ncbi:MAG: hypothetical protein ABI397_03015 [Candidatus Saccharimonas sp.]